MCPNLGKWSALTGFHPRFISKAFHEIADSATAKHVQRTQVEIWVCFGKGCFLLDLCSHISTLHLCFAQGNVPQGTTFCSKAGQGGAGIWMLFGMIFGNFFSMLLLCHNALFFFIWNWFYLAVLWWIKWRADYGPYKMINQWTMQLVEGWALGTCSLGLLIFRSPHEEILTKESVTQNFKAFA